MNGSLGIIIASALAMTACGDSPAKIQQQATENAELYAAKLEPGATVIACSSQDSDDNGYVSCDLRRPNGEPVQVECGYGGEKGCKAKR